MTEPDTLPPRGAVPRSTLLGMTLLTEGGLGLLAWGLGHLCAVPVLVTLHWRPADAALGLAAALPMLATFALALRSDWRPLREVRAFLDESLGLLFATSTWLDLVFVSAAAGLGEELFFRGLVQAGLGRWLGPATGLVLASLLFGLAHPFTRAYVALATLLGLYLGGLWLLTGRLLIVVVAHGAYDLVALLWLTRELRLDDRMGSERGSFHAKIAEEERVVEESDDETMT